MLYVPIVPKGAEKLLDGSGAKRVFCFADLALEDREYRLWFQNTKKEILLDHPIYELQPHLNLFDTFEVLDLINPTIATIPDKHEDPDTTWSMFLQYAEALHQHVTSHKLRTRLMGVPQGIEFHEILQQALDMADTGLCDVLGIGVKRSNFGLKRSELVDAIQQKHPNMRFHLLGARWPYADELSMRDNEAVESCDTAEPVNAALNGVYLRESVSTDVGRAENFQQLADKAWTKRELVWYNMDDMSRLLRAKSNVTLAELRAVGVPTE